MNEMILIGGAIREYRKELEMTAKEVAEKLNAKVPTYLALENGNVNFNLRMCCKVYRVCKVLDMNYDQLFKDCGVFDECIEWAKAFCEREEKRNKELKEQYVVPNENETNNKSKYKAMYLIVRQTEDVRYYTGSHVEWIGNTTQKHRLYSFNTHRSQAVQFDDYKKAKAIADRLHNVEIWKVVA